jgi:hypothetical protein
VGEPGTVADDVPRPELKHAYLLVKITALNHAHTGQQYAPCFNNYSKYNNNVLIITIIFLYY